MDSACMSPKKFHFDDYEDIPIGRKNNIKSH